MTKYLNILTTNTDGIAEINACEDMITVLAESVQEAMSRKT